jgi:hypothetical protein
MAATHKSMQAPVHRAAPHRLPKRGARRTPAPNGIPGTRAARARRDPKTTSSPLSPASVLNHEGQRWLAPLGGNVTASADRTFRTKT